MKLDIYASILLAILIATPVFIGTANANMPTVSVSPSSKTVQVGDQFSVDINLDYAENLYGYEIRLSFDSSKLNATALEYKGYLNEPTNQWPQTIDNVAGYVDFAVSSHLPAQAKNGSSPPPLVTIHFKAIALGTSPLHLVENKTILVSALNNGMPIPHQTSDGTVTVVPLVHDVATTSINPSKTVVGEGYSMSINVTVQNKGGCTETFKVTAYANATSIGSQNVTLPRGNSGTITFAWNTSGFVKGNYAISACAAPVFGETNTTDNILSDGWIFISILGDITGDRKVDIQDLARESAAFGSIRITNSSDPRRGQYWHPYACPTCPHTPNADINNDGKCDIQDLARTSANFGKRW